ncbi:MAG: o-succinylbenzoate synthase [Rubrobacteraceae bacterium]|nr:o-succinylbenzoate synthase [Rubrobacter sp.]
MRISGFGIYRYALPFTEPLTLKGTTLHGREGLLLRLTGDDSEGWGEAAPLPGFSRETLDEATDQLLEASEAMSATGRSPSENVPATLGATTAPSVRFAVELATLNLNANRRDASALELLDTNASGLLPVNGLLSGLAYEVVAEARRMRDAGYRAVKLKVGGLPVREDAELVRDVGGVLGDGVSLRLDANRAWSFDEAMEFARATRDVHIEYVEEPLADAALLPRFAEEVNVPVALDESLVGMEPEDLAPHGYAWAIVLKPTLLGGISHTLRFADQARRLGITPVISAAYECGIGTLGLISLSVAIGGAPAGLDTYRRLAGDVLIPPLELHSPTIDVRSMLEATRSVDADRLELIASF